MFILITLPKKRGYFHRGRPSQAKGLLMARARPKGLRREHQRYLRFFLMGLEIWKHIVIQFRSKALPLCRPAVISYRKNEGLSSSKSKSKPLCRLCRICRIYSLKIYKNQKPHQNTQKQKQQKISYISYRTYREAQKRKTSPIIFQNSCMIQSESYTEKEKTFQIQ